MTLYGYARVSVREPEDKNLDLQVERRLLGLAKCRSCGHDMIASHDLENYYICPTRAQTGPDNCPTPPLGADLLDRLVTVQLIDSVMTQEGNLKTVVNIVQEESRNETLAQLKEIDQVEDQLTQQEWARTADCRRAREGNLRPGRPPPGGTQQGQGNPQRPGQSGQDRAGRPGYRQRRTPDTDQREGRRHLPAGHRPGNRP